TPNLAGGTSSWATLTAWRAGSSSSRFANWISQETTRRRSGSKTLRAGFIAYPFTAFGKYTKTASAFGIGRRPHHEKPFCLLTPGAVATIFRREKPMGGKPLVSGNLAGVIKLPAPRPDSKISVESALRRRRSVREFRRGALTLAETSQLLWAAQGITGPEGQRTAPSAGALYPLEVFLVTCDQDELPAGVYRYRPQGHELNLVVQGDKRAELAGAAREQ